MSKSTYFVGKTEYRANGTIKAFHLPVTRFKRVLTEKDFPNCPKDFSIRIQVGNRDHMHDIQPREFGGVNLFDKYHNRQSCEASALVAEAVALCEAAKNANK